MLGSSEGIVPSHSHHGIQIVITLDGESAVEVEGRWLAGRGIIVPPDVPHAYSARGASGAMLFVDPESSEGAWLRSTVGESVTIVPEIRVAPAAAALRTFLERPFESRDLGSIIRSCVQSLCAGAPPSRRLDPRVTAVLESIRASNDLRISLEAAASTIHLSPSRFQHLFKQQVGLPFRRYVLWRKLTRAMVAIGCEPTLTAAAQTSDFADAAHLTRTFQQMFGIPPSVMMQGRFFTIASPFDMLEASAA